MRIGHSNLNELFYMNSDVCMVKQHIDFPVYLKITDNGENIKMFKIA